MTDEGESSKSRREAAEWFVEHESGQELSTAASSDWSEWIRDPDNRAEYIAVIGLRQNLRAMARPSLPNRQDLLHDSFDLAAAPAGRSQAARARRPLFAGLRLPFNTGTFAIATAALGVFAVICGFIFRYGIYSLFDAATAAARSYATAPGEQRDYRLIDGSTITLGGYSSINVSFTASQRTVVMNRGEGLFRVQHERKRPFVVCAREACVTAVGTVFDVHLYSNHVRVWVQEGKVNLTPKLRALNGGVPYIPASSAPIPLTNGQEMSYDATGTNSEPELTEVSVNAAWTKGWLIYHGSVLKDVIEDVQRYTAQPIQVDPAAANLRYSGSVMQQHVDQWLEGLSKIFPLDVFDCRDERARRGAEALGLPDGCKYNSNSIVIRLRTTP